MCEHFLDIQFQYKQFYKILFTASPYTLVHSHSKLLYTQVQHGGKKEKHLRPYPTPQKPILRLKGIWSLIGRLLRAHTSSFYP